MRVSENIFFVNWCDKNDNFQKAPFNSKQTSKGYLQEL